MGGNRFKHNVPLSEAACAVLLAVKGDTIPHPSALVFTNPVGLQIGDTVLLKLARRLEPDMPEVTVHGFRSCFRDWVSDETDHAREVAEHALAHKVKGLFPWSVTVANACRIAVAPVSRPSSRALAQADCSA